MAVEARLLAPLDEADRKALAGPLRKLALIMQAQNTDG